MNSKSHYAARIRSCSLKNVKRSQRFRVVFRVAALVLLMWTSADLTTAELCALDREGFPIGAETSSDVDGRSAPPLAPSQQDSHVDDCFCCSHCVEPGYEFHVDRSTQEVGQLAAAPTRRVLTTYRSLYRPPQVSN